MYALAALGLLICMGAVALVIRSSISSPPVAPKTNDTATEPAQRPGTDRPWSGRIPIAKPVADLPEAIQPPAQPPSTAPTPSDAGVQSDPRPVAAPVRPDAKGILDGLLVMSPLDVAFGQVVADLSRDGEASPSTRASMTELGPSGAPLLSIAGVWRQRLSVLERAIQGGKLRLAVPSIMPGKQAFLVEVEGERILVDVEGARSDLPRTLFPMAEQARIYGQIADADGSTALDHQVGFVAQVLAADLDRAVVNAKRHDSGWSAGDREQLQAALGLARRRAMIQAGLDGRDSAMHGDIASVERCIQRINRAGGDQYLAESITQRLRALAADQPPAHRIAPQAAASSTGAAGPASKGFTRMTGEWHDGNHGLENAGPASLGRDDLIDARTVTVSFFPRSAAGSVKIQVDGVTIGIDLAASVWQASSRSARGGSQAVPVWPRSRNTLVLDRSDPRALIVNLNGSEQRVPCSRSSSDRGLTWACSDGAVVALMEVVAGQRATEAPTLGASSP